MGKLDGCLQQAHVAGAIGDARADLGAKLHNVDGVQKRDRHPFREIAVHGDLAAQFAQSRHGIRPATARNLSMQGSVGNLDTHLTGHVARLGNDAEQPLDSVVVAQRGIRHVEADHRLRMAGNQVEAGAAHDRVDHLHEAELLGNRHQVASRNDIALSRLHPEQAFVHHRLLVGRTDDRLMPQGEALFIERCNDVYGVLAVALVLQLTVGRRLVHHEGRADAPRRLIK